MKDRESDDVKAVQPVVCVTRVNRGSDVTVSISFLEEDNPPSSQVDLTTHSTIQCSSASNQLSRTVDTSNYNLFHVETDGSTSKLNVALNGASAAYFYDE